MQICRGPIERQATLACTQICASASHIMCKNSLLIVKDSRNRGLGHALENVFEAMPSKMSENALQQNRMYFFSSLIFKLRKRNKTFFFFFYISRLKTNRYHLHSTVPSIVKKDFRSPSLHYGWHSQLRLIFSNKTKTRTTKPRYMT